MFYYFSSLHTDTSDVTTTCQWDGGRGTGVLGGQTKGVGLHTGAADSGSGFFNTYLIPFGSSVNVTVTLGGGTVGESDYFWLVMRGRTKAVLEMPGGLALPKEARLRSYEQRVRDEMQGPPTTLSLPLLAFVERKRESQYVFFSLTCDSAM